jgi:serine phosphatase RsbU (regulator of sigma subunit)
MRCTGGEAGQPSVPVPGAGAHSHAGADLLPRPAPPSLLQLLPLAVMAVVAVVDLLAGPRIGFLPLLSLGPALAAVSYSPFRTALTGGLALGLCVLLALYDARLDSRPGTVALATVFGVTAAGLLASAGRQRREHELANVRAVAEVAQRVLLRPVARNAYPPVQVAVRYLSANATAHIGGDLYEVLAGPGVLRLIVGDVQGKGLPAVQTAATVLGAFRSAAHDAPGLEQIAEQIEISLERQDRDEEFVTAVLAEVSDGGSRVDILNCGHPPPLMVRAAAVSLVEPVEAGLPLGLTSFASSPRSLRSVTLGPGDQILFYTDGISEARDKSGEFYPLERSGPLLDGQPPEAALDRLYRDVIQYVGHVLNDDAAMLLISRRDADRPRPAQL